MLRMKRIVSCFMVVCIAASSLIMNGALVTPKAYATETADEWTELSGKLDGYKGIYTKDTQLGSPWNTNHSPDGPLMGNGTVYAFMAGDRKEQNIYISRSDMWRDRSSNNGQQYTTFGGLTIKTSDGDNLALKKNVTVLGFTSSNEHGSKLVDGFDDTKWCSTPATNNNSITYWAVIDLGEAKDISRWVVKHAQAGGESATMNTKDFKLQYTTQANPQGATDSDWIDADAVTGNTAAITDRNLPNSIQTRYVRLLVTKAEQGTGNTVRLYGLELYQQPKTTTSVSEFRYEEDMKNAEVMAQSEQGFKTRTWLSAKENMIVTEIINITNSPILMEVSAWTANDNTSASIDGKMMVASKAGISKASTRVSGTGTWNGWTVNVSMASKIIDDIAITVKNVDTRTNKTVFTLPTNKTIILVSAVEGGKQEGTTTNTLDQTIIKAKAKVESRSTVDSLITANQAHRDYWKQYWLKSYINIQDEQVERMYYGLLYMLGCATSISSENNAGLSAGLFPWTANDNPDWQGDYTTNTDMQRQVHPLVTANRLEGIQNYVNVLEAYWPEAQRRSNSAQHLNWVIQGTGRPNQFTQGISGGALFPTHIGPWGASTEQYNDSRDYWNSPADASSVLMPLVKMWQYNQDEAYLKDHLYPMMKSVAIFWEKYVTLENGKYVVYGATHEGAAGRNAIFDIDACVYILRNAIDAAKVLGVDADKIPVWQNIIDNMSPQPTFLWNGKVTISDIEGRTQQNPGYTFDGNPVTIQSVYYYDAAGMSTPADKKEKYVNYLNVKNGIGNARRLTSATHLGYDIHEIIEQLKIGSISPKPSDWSGLRGNNTIGDIGGSSLLGVIQDSLLQSNEGYLNIFANWFDDQAASFKRLRARGAFLVDANQNDLGQTTYVKILSEQGKDLSFLNPWPGHEMEIYEDSAQIPATKRANALGEIYTVPTKANSSYELKPVGGLRNMTLVSITPPAAITDVATGTAKTTAALGLPSRVQLVTDQKNVQVVVVWDITNASYNPTLKEPQTFTVNGIVTLPDTIENPNNVPLLTSIHVTVNKIPQSQIKATATSEELINGSDAASNAIDGNPQTMWHTKWDKSDVLPQSITLNLGGTYNINKVAYLPRQGGGNGTITAYNIYVSTDGATFTKVASGNWANDSSEKYVTFPPSNASFIKLEATAGVGGWASAAELNVFVEPTKVPQFVGITAPANITGVANGTAKTAAGLGLPSAVALVTDAGSVNAGVTWDVPGSSYDPALKSEQNFTVNGTVHLPENVANPNNVALTTSIQITVNAAAASNLLHAVLSGNDKTMAGTSFDLTYGLQNVTDAIYAQDLTIAYDPAKLDFVSADSMKEGFVIVDQDNKSGQVHLVAASLGEGKGVTADGPQLALNWKAKSLLQMDTADITITNVIVADGEGVEIQLEGVTHRIQIIAAASKDKLKAMIGNAQLLHDSAVEGTKPSQYPIGSKAVLQANINKAKAVADDENATQMQVDQAMVDLSTALQTFRDSVVQRMLEDLNGDGRISVGDLALVAQYYGRTFADPNWDKIKHADINGDGTINIVDLSMVARKILDSL
ncbi:discoidin domain-containing protein [Paenibacillus terrigena]|uniref:discoidin domain-containing protein n=1 Tax=Paenibacillus terrigena TaxID=369333 RepID=UPI0028D0B2E6|nr:discoidin domain-containing protein [Paenibacillus terrigena]